MRSSKEYPLTEKQALKCAIEGCKVRASEYAFGDYVYFDRGRSEFIFHRADGHEAPLMRHYPHWQVIRELDENDPESYRDLTRDEIEQLVGQVVVFSCPTHTSIRVVTAAYTRRTGVDVASLGAKAGSEVTAGDLRMNYTYRDTGKPVGVLKK